VSTEIGDVLRAVGRIEGRLDAFRADLAAHARHSAASMAELKVEITKRGDDQEKRLTSLEHSRTEDKTAKRVIGGFIAFVGLSNVVMWIKSPWS